MNQSGSTRSNLMMRLFYIPLLSGILCLSLYAQNPSVIFEIESDDRGLLIPRTAAVAINTPVEGLLIYDTIDHAFKYYKGNAWITLADQVSSDFYYVDKDGDSYGDPYNAVFAPLPPPHYVDNNLDCDDTNDQIHPSAEEVCDSIDNNCNGLFDDQDPTTIGRVAYYADSDQDGYGDPDNDTLSCSHPAGFVTNNLDCDDTNEDINPMALEICDGADNDCDGLIDDQDTVFLSPFCTTCSNCNCPESSIALNTTDPAEAALAMGICQALLSAQWVLPDGSPPPSTAEFRLGHGVLDSLGANVLPQEGSKLLALSTGTARAPSDPGYAGDLGKYYQNNFPTGFPVETLGCSSPYAAFDGVGLKVTLIVPLNATGFSFDFKYYSYDYPTYTCTQFVDQSAVIMNPGPSGSAENILFDPDGHAVDANSTSTIQVCSTSGNYDCPLGTGELTGTGFEGHGGSAWLPATASCQGGTVIELIFSIWDSGDGSFTSTILFDNFQWITD